MMAMMWFSRQRKALPLAALFRRAGWFALSYVLVMGALFLLYLALHLH
jgi:hypothetical protein